MTKIDWTVGSSILIGVTWGTFAAFSGNRLDVIISVLWFILASLETQKRKQI